MTDPVSAVSIDSLTVRYGATLAVDGVVIDIPRGSVYGLLGRNGAGKSSLIKCLVGHRQPDGGAVRILGMDAWRDRKTLMERVGIVPEDADAPPDTRVGDIASFCSRFYSRWDAASVDARLDRFGIDVQSRFGQLSKGQRKQVSLALALAMSPEVLILDDPTLGLDVVARKSLFEEVIAELSDRGITVLVTTHDLAGVETLVDRVGILMRGRLVLNEEAESLKARFRRVRYAAQPLALAAGDLQAATVRSWGTGTEAIVSNYDEISFERFRSSHEVAEIAPMTLEDIFITITENEGTHS